MPVASVSANIITKREIVKERRVEKCNNVTHYAILIANE